MKAMGDPEQMLLATSSTAIIPPFILDNKFPGPTPSRKDFLTYGRQSWWSHSGQVCDAILAKASWEGLLLAEASGKVLFTLESGPETGTLIFCCLWSFVCASNSWDLATIL